MSKLIIDYDLSVQPAMDRDTRIRDTAPEMLELMKQVVRTWEYDAQFIPCDTEAASALSNKLARLAAQAAPLLAKIEGGGE